MAKYVIKRLALLVLQFFVISFCLYVVFCLIPSNEILILMDDAKTELSPEEFKEQYSDLHLRIGLADLIVQRYARWLGLTPGYDGTRSGVLQGDFGYSYGYGKDIVGALKYPLANTILLNLFAAIMTLAITIPSGVHCAVKANGKVDRFMQVVTVIGNSLPLTLISLFSVYIFAVKLRILPVGGMKTAGLTSEGIIGIADRIYHMILPAMVITFSQVAGLTRTVRAAMIDSLSQDYIRTARAKGLKEKVVIYSHAWRNAFFAISTTLFDRIVGIFAGGSLMVEHMFSLVGTGYMLWNAMQTSDYDLVMALEMLFVVVSITGRFIMDIIYTIIDPRVKFD